VFDQLRSDKDHKNVIEQGFTLVELLIVIVIMGILAGIVVFAVGNLTDNATKKSCLTEYETVRTAQAAYKANNPTDTTPTWAEITAANTGVLDASSVKFKQAGALVATTPEWKYDDTTYTLTKSNACV
jgi:prepilin-type N-terminal cleavage/methylation domain-containing protein